MIDSVCVTWIESEERYRITLLSSNKPLLTKYAYDMHEVIKILDEEENAA